MQQQSIRCESCFFDFSIVPQIFTLPLSNLRVFRSQIRVRTRPNKHAHIGGTRLTLGVSHVRCPRHSKRFFTATCVFRLDPLMRIAETEPALSKSWQLFASASARVIMLIRSAPSGIWPQAASKAVAPITATTAIFEFISNATPSKNIHPKTSSAGRKK